MNELRDIFTKYKAVVFFDTETTGLEADRCQIIELAAIRVEKTERGTLRMADSADVFVKLPEGERIPQKIVELTGITDEQLENEGITEAEAAARFTELISGGRVLLVAHKTMSNSSLVDCTVYSPNHSGKRTHSIDRLTPHCVVGQLSAETIGACFPKGRDASCNYGIGYDGRVCLIVDECNRSWCSSSNANDQRAITIECASDKAEPYAMKSAVYEKLIKLCADICKRNGKTKVLWLGSKEKALAYEPKANEIVLTAHRWFANKSCPGDWLYSRYGELADRINALLGSTDSGNSGGNNTPSGGSGVKYYVQTGAYKQKANADAQLKKVKAAGFDAILKQSGGFYKVQTGAYSKKENADAEVKKLKAKGFDAIVTTDGGNAAGSASSEIKVGDVVQFSGGPHYGSAAASTAAGSPKAGPAKVTRIVKGAKHPYHIVHTDSQSNVYGWVDAANVSK